MDVIKHVLKIGVWAYGGQTVLQHMSDIVYWKIRLGLFKKILI